MDIISNSFKEFVDDRFTRYRLGRQFYPDGPYPGNQYCQNPYLKTEADVQVKFGGYLESWLIYHDPELVVHAELPVYSSPHQRADLTVHRLVTDEYWVSQHQIFETLEYVIEIKFANVANPYYDFNNGGVEKDFRQLQSLRNGINRYLILVDEAELIEPDQIKKFIDDAKTHKIIIVSNNPKLVGIA